MMHRMRCRLLLTFLLGGLPVSVALALSTSPPPVLNISFNYESRQVALAEEELAALDSAVNGLARVCESREVLWGSVGVTLALASLPRKDYQLLGERLQILRSHLLEKHQVPDVSLEMATSSAYEGWPGSPSDYKVWATVVCLKRKGSQ